MSDTNQIKTKFEYESEEEMAYWLSICPHCHFPQMSCDCPQFDSEGNEL